ncbi:MAG: rane protein [Verrucomicrobiales bacterium]|nr:rane protein [Verrucomicrobiales bacterium]
MEFRSGYHPALPMTDPVNDRLDTMQRIELASGVEIELHPAGPVVRAKAWLIDLLWMGAAYAIGSIAAGLIGALVGAEGYSGLMALFMFFMSWGYRVLYERLKGATPGKKSCGLRVVMTDGGPVTWTAAILRNLLRVADFLPAAYVTGLMSCLLSRRFQRLGDLVADTMVVYSHPRAMAVSLMPDGAWTEAVRPSVALTKEERVAVIRYNERLPMWSQGRREELAAQLEPLTGATGAEGVRRLAGIGFWLRDS